MCGPVTPLNSSGCSRGRSGVTDDYLTTVQLTVKVFPVIVTEATMTEVPVPLLRLKLNAPLVDAPVPIELFAGAVPPDVPA